MGNGFKKAKSESQFLFQLILSQITRSCPPRKRVNTQRIRSRAPFFFFSFFFISLKRLFPARLFRIVDRKAD